MHFVIEIIMFSVVNYHVMYNSENSQFLGSIVRVGSLLHSLSHVYFPPEGGACISFSRWLCFLVSEKDEGWIRQLKPA